LRPRQDSNLRRSLQEFDRAVSVEPFHRSRKERGSMIRRHIIWRNRHVDDMRLRQVVARADVA
jgi:hypothetical protein